jgi:hypothetical protein
MQRLSTKNRYVLFHHLVEKLLKSSDWELLNSLTSNCLFRHKCTLRVFKLVEFPAHSPSLTPHPELCIDEEFPEL